MTCGPMRGRAARRDERRRVFGEPGRLVSFKRRYGVHSVKQLDQVFTFA